VRVFFVIIILLFFSNSAMSEILNLGNISVEYSCDDSREMCFVETTSHSGNTLSKITWGLHQLIGVGGDSGVFQDDYHKSVGKFLVLRKYGGYNDRVLLINQVDGFIHDLPGEQICPTEGIISTAFGLEGERKKLVFSLDSETIEEVRGFGNESLACTQN